MYIMDDGIRLNAKLDMPESHGEKCPLVIVIHGFTPTTRSNTASTIRNITIPRNNVFIFN